MTEVVTCRTCGSLVLPHQIDGRCYTCDKPTCQNCYRICEKCGRIFCMDHVSTRIIMRQQQPYLHRLCDACAEVWQ